ncbi:MAG: glycosyltransferase family 9 protein [SAR324 cluster bacterium]|nr:glycosyltransferase family 9 protein [SAR324 cluster bacterium]MBL7035733.1 glycosyltransferase family 9 protein [SAR324 cluster bacterium]
MSRNTSSEYDKRFLLIRTDRIGDTILTLPAVTALRKQYPEAFIAFLAQPYTIPLIEQYAGIDLLLDYQPAGRHKGWQGIRQLSHELQEHNFDVALLLYPRAELAFALFSAKIPVRISTGFRWYSFLMTERIFEHRKDCKKHEAEYNLSLLKSLLPNQIPPPEYDFKEWIAEPWWAGFQQELNAAKYVILHPGSGASAPNLNLEQYRLITRLLLENTDWTVLLTGVYGEENLVEKIAANFPEKRVKSIVGRFSLAEIFSVIRNASLLITSSTGPLHLANAAGTPLLGFFCPAKPHTPKRWGPYDQQEWVVTPKLEWPEICELKYCPHGGCLQQLSEQRITEVLCEHRLKNIQKKIKPTT